MTALRIFTIDERSDSPVPGVVLTFHSGSGSDESPALRTLITDAQGFASCKLEESLVATTSQVSVVYGPNRQVLTVSTADLRKGHDTFRIRVSAVDVAAVVAPTGLPSVEDPDPRDAVLSPASIGLIPQLQAPGGLCGQLMPTTMGVKRFGAFQIHADICDLQTINCPAPNRPGATAETKYVRGKILEYEIAWYPLGNALGELLNTITLAPCEQVAVAVSDWMRRETAIREESSLSEQERTEHIDHDRLIVETLDSTVKTKSLAASFAGSIGATFPIKKVNVTATAGGGVSGSISTQQVAASTTNHLAEHITQAATLVMSYRSSVVFQSTASEQRLYQTRFVRNHNRCHTLTLMYYQVNRNYRVVVDYKGERDAILIQYPNLDFDARRAYCNAAVLRDALLDKSLDECFDRLGDALFCCDEKPTGTDVRMESVTLTMDVTNVLHVGGLGVTLLTANGPIQLPHISTFTWQAGTHTEVLTLQAPIDPTIVTGVLIVANSFGIGVSFLAVNQLTLTYKATGVTNPLALNSSPQPFIFSHAWSADVKAELPPVDPEDNPCVDASCCIKKLLGHLNCQKRYYNSAIWLNENPNDRVMRWSCCRGSDGSVDLISLIENTPIAVYGDFVVFPVAGSPLVDDPTVLPVSRLVTIPTPGVYSEGILGRCDTCEIIDPHRFTDWKCEETAPSIPDFPDPQGGVKPGDLKPDAISNQINLTSVPTAPDSIIKSLLETLLSDAKAGSDESKALLDKLFDLIKETLTKSSTADSSS